MRPFRAKRNGRNFCIPPPLHNMRIPYRQKHIQTGTPQIIIAITIILGKIKTIIRPPECIVMQNRTRLELTGQLDRIIHVLVIRVKIQRILTSRISPLNRIQVNIHFLIFRINIIPLVYRVLGSTIRKPLDTMIIQIKYVKRSFNFIQSVIW